MYTYGYPFQQQQPMTDIGPANSEQEALDTYVQAGRSKIIFTADDKTVVVKSVSVTGQTSVDIFDRRAPAPVSAPTEYVTREELNAVLEALKPAKKAAKTEVSE
jgi:hypothetical protein